MKPDIRNQRQHGNIRRDHETLINLYPHIHPSILSTKNLLSLSLSLSFFYQKIPVQAVKQKGRGEGGPYRSQPPIQQTNQHLNRSSYQSQVILHREECMRARDVGEEAEGEAHGRDAESDDGKVLKVPTERFALSSLFPRWSVGWSRGWCFFFSKAARLKGNGFCMCFLPLPLPSFLFFFFSSFSSFSTHFLHLPRSFLVPGSIRTISFGLSTKLEKKPHQLSSSPPFLTPHHHQQIDSP